MLKLEKTHLQIGFMPLTDAAPLVVAREMGLFERFGLQVELKKQNSWATLRDKLQAGMLDAAQMLAPMPLASSLGLGGIKAELITPFVLSFNGNGITLSERLYQQICQVSHADPAVPPLPLPADLIGKVALARREAGQGPLRFATVFPYSCHYYQLCHWLQSGGVQIGRDVAIQVIPPTSMVAALHEGIIEGYCVGGPWNAKAVRSGLGVTVVTSCDIWPDSPEKVLGLTADWQERHPNTTLALLGALQQACQWLESVANRFEAARILTRSEYLHADLDVVAPALLGSCLVHKDLGPRSVPAYNRFCAMGDDGSNQPKIAYARNLLAQMERVGHISPGQASEELAFRVYRPDLYSQMRDSLLADHASARQPGSGVMPGK